MKVVTVGDLIRALEKFPKEHKVEVNVDNAYTAYICAVYLDEYEKRQGRDVVTLRV